MPYKIHKLRDDKRNNTVGMFIPNGGFYRVVEMTFENHRQLALLSERPGYSVDYVEGELGFFDKDGNEVDEETIEVDQFSKLVTHYDLKKKTVRGKEQVKKAKHVDDERDRVVAAALSVGIRNPHGFSTQFLKNEIGRMNLPRQGSLANL